MGFNSGFKGLIHIVLLSARFIGGTAHSLWRPSHCPDTPTRSY